MEQSPSVILRPLTLEDAPLVFEITSDESAAKFMRFDTHTQLSEACKLIEGYQRPGARAYAVLDAGCGDFVGYIALSEHEHEHEHGCYAMSTMLLPRFWNKGYSTRVVASLKELAEKEGEIRSLTGHVVGDNWGSRKMLEKNGFTVAEELHFDDLPCGLFVYRWDATSAAQ